MQLNQSMTVAMVMILLLVTGTTDAAWPLF